MALEERTLHKAKNPGLIKHVMLYHLCFTLAIAVNAPFVALMAWEVLPAASGSISSGTAGLITITVSILMRSELFLSGLYACTCRMPGVRSMPSSLRYWLAQCLYHAPGGIHSGCAVAATAWVAVYAAQWWLAPVFGPGLAAAPPPAVAAAAAALAQLALLAGMIVLAMPFVRHRHHNLFEWSHRYFGWTLLAVVWAHLATAAAFRAGYAPDGCPLAQPGGAGAELAADPGTWVAAAATVLVFHPWLFVRRRSAAAAVPHKRSCLLLTGFPGHAPAGTFGRVALRWYGEWHAFAAVSCSKGSRSATATARFSPSKSAAVHPAPAGGRGQPEGPAAAATDGHHAALGNGSMHSMVVAPAGDWTRARIEEAAAGAGDVEASGSGSGTLSLYVRLIRAPGFMYTTRMWSRIVCVATGAGIAPVLPCILQRTAPSIHLVWVVNSPEGFGPVTAALQDALDPKQLCIHDTNTEGRPDIVALALKAVRLAQAEAMYIVANLPVTYAAVRGCRAVGVCAFGAIWDS